MQLYSGRPFWLVRNGPDEKLSTESRPFPAGQEFDVAIVGAGITGALVADALAAEHLAVVVLDRRLPATGSTAASTALISYEIDVELNQLIAQVGEEDAVRSYRLSAAAVAQLGRIAGSLDAPCGFAERASLYLASAPEDAERLQREVDVRRRHGLDAEYWSAERVATTYGFPSHGAVRTESAGVVDPVRFTRALLARAVGRGAELLPETRVQGVSRAGSWLRITTDRGELRAGRVVYAMGYETPEQLQPDMVALHSTYVLATEPVADLGPWHDQCLVWETARPYVYMRTTEDGRILVGGADVPFEDHDRRDAVLPARIRLLEARLSALLPSVRAKTALEWAGTFAETRDGLPFIGPSECSPRALFALGYGGNGITFGVVAAVILRDLCLGWPNADAHLFRLDR